MSLLEPATTTLARQTEDAAPKPAAGEVWAPLVRAAQAGDAAAFEQLVSNCYLRIYQAAYRWAGSRSDAQDIAQEACVKLVGGLRHYRFEAPFMTWLYRIVLNAAKDWNRSVNRRRECGGQAFDDLHACPAPDAGPEQAAATVEALRAVTRLPAKLRQAVFLVHCEGLSHREAGLVLGCAESTISWRLSQARKSLAMMLGEDDHHG